MIPASIENRLRSAVYGAIWDAIVRSEEAAILCFSGKLDPFEVGAIAQEVAKEILNRLAQSNQSSSITTIGE